MALCAKLKQKLAVTVEATVQAAAWLFKWGTPLLPIILLCITVSAENIFDRIFIAEYPHRDENYFLCVSTVGMTGNVTAMGPLLAASTLFPGRMVTGSSETVVDWFKWGNPARDSAVATRELTARFVLEIADLSVAFAALLAIAKCLCLLYRLWGKFPQAIGGGCSARRFLSA